ncbi:MAG: hypothetical protein ITG02_07000 [Patulibacter sp.]|nr:hypothetical protein [Patulibacter sp.]
MSTSHKDQEVDLAFRVRSAERLDRPTRTHNVLNGAGDIVGSLSFDLPPRTFSADSAMVFSGPIEDARQLHRAFARSTKSALRQFRPR